MSDTDVKPAVSLGVIFLTIFIDLLGFTIIFPLFPAILQHYLAVDGGSGLLGWLVARIDDFARLAGSHSNYREVLFGGVLGSIYSFLQFLMSPVWGAMSDRMGRRFVLLVTVSGTVLSYVLWFFSGSFGLFVLARLIGGGFAGNLSVATAAVADVTTRENRAKGMGLVGVAFGLGFLFGPALGSIAAMHDFSPFHPRWVSWGVNPFSGAALLALVFSLINLLWVATRFKETLDPLHRDSGGSERIRHPLHALLNLEPGPVRRTDWMYFIFTLAFVGMEFSLPFLATDRFHYTAASMYKLFVFLGFMLILTQGGLVRRAVPRFGERAVLLAGMVVVVMGFLLTGFSPTRTWLYLGLAGLGIGSGLSNPTFSALVSLYSRADQQGRMLGVFRSLGSLARGIGPLVACLIYWWRGAVALYLVGALVLIIPLVFALRLPAPKK
ncbi:MAG: MFS transporter [Opitutaceae bacterium]|jgi:MFS family permease